METRLARVWMTLVFFCFFASARAAPGDLKSECEDIQSPRKFTLCIFRTEGSQNPDVLYYFHGGTGDAHEWEKPGRYGERIRQTWSQLGFEAPTVVAVSFGPFWVLTEQNGRAASGIMEVFLNDIMPMVENQKLGGLHGKRLVAGESLGGYNTSQLVLKHGALFDRAAIMCPAITAIGPYANVFEVYNFVHRTGADPSWVAAFMSFSRTVFPNTDTWEKASVLRQAPLSLNAQSPRMHVSCGRQDNFGFFEGAHAFAEQARQNGARVTWEEFNGGHCTVDTHAVGLFLAEP